MTVRTVTIDIDTNLGQVLWRLIKQLMEDNPGIIKQEIEK